MELARLKTVSLDRKSTAVKTPKRLTIIESPVGKVAQTTSFVLSTDDVSKSSPKKKAEKPSAPPSPTKKSQKPATPPSPSKKGSHKVAGTGSESDAEKPAGASSTISEKATPPRPTYTRMNSQVVVVEEVQTPAAVTQNENPFNFDVPITEEPEEDHESLRLADIQSFVEAEQAKDRRTSVLSSGSSGLGVPYLSDLESLDSVIVKHAALWLLNHSELKDKFDADDVLEGIEIRKGGLWNRFFKGEKKVKKKGMNIPHDLTPENAHLAQVSSASHLNSLLKEMAWHRALGYPALVRRSLHS